MKRMLTYVGLFILLFMLYRVFVTELVSRILHIPDDACYYETHHAPDWVVRYFMDEGYHVDKGGNLFLGFLELVASAITALLICIALKRKTLFSVGRS